MRLKDTSCQPDAGQTWLTIGQDLFSIEEYVMSQYNATLHQASTLRSGPQFHQAVMYPAAAMIYTDIQSLRGLEKPVDYGSGVEFASGLVDAMPGVGIQVGLWLDGTKGCQDIISGALDHNIRRMFKYFDHLETEKVFLRVGYEFDNPNFGYSDSPETYKDAFIRMVELCEKHMGRRCHKKIAFVWHSWAAPKVAALDDFFPGEEYVDWVGISLFQQFYPWANSGPYSAGNIQDIEEVTAFATKYNKPIMIAESTPFGGILWQGNDWDEKLAKYNVSGFNVWDMWFEPVLALIEKYDIKMWSYIDCNWESQPMWDGVGFGDTRLVQSKTIMKSWSERVLQNPRFRNDLECKQKHASTQSRFDSREESVVPLPTSLDGNPEPKRFDLATLFAPFCFLVIGYSIMKWRATKKRQERNANTKACTNDGSSMHMLAVDRQHYGAITE